eukprot:7121230-Pyramimonas_sp.AAC.1
MTSSLNPHRQSLPSVESGLSRTALLRVLLGLLMAGLLVVDLQDIRAPEVHLPVAWGLLVEAGRLRNL